MKQELSANNKIVVTKVGDFWVDEEQATKINYLITSGAKGMLDLEGSLISIFSIEGVLTPEAYMVLNNRRQGMWQCKYKAWHERNQKCSHGELMGRR